MGLYESRNFFGSLLYVEFNKSIVASHTYSTFGMLITKSEYGILFCFDIDFIPKLCNQEVGKSISPYFQGKMRRLSDLNGAESRKI